MDRASCPSQRPTVPCAAARPHPPSDARVAASLDATAARARLRTLAYQLRAFGGELGLSDDTVATIGADVLDRPREAE